MLANPFFDRDKLENKMKAKLLPEEVLLHNLQVSDFFFPFRSTVEKES